MLHRSRQQELLEAEGRICFLPLPILYTPESDDIEMSPDSTLSSLSNSIPSSQERNSPTSSWRSPCALASSGISNSSSTASLSTPSSSDSTEGTSNSDSDSSSFQSAESDASSDQISVDESLIGYEDADSEDSLPILDSRGPEINSESFECRDENFKHFMETKGFLVGLSIRHATTCAFLDDLLKELNANDNKLICYNSFSGVRKALLRNAMLKVTSHPACPCFHQALQTNVDFSVQECEYCVDPIRSVSDFEYISIWDRLSAMIMNKETGPKMYGYYKTGLRNVDSPGAENYVDFFSGSHFRDLVHARGGKDEVEYDIFLSLSADGASPFKSSSYTYWPVAVTILNLPPAERFQSQNLLPVLVIPGPNDPKDLTSFLNPLILEMESLSNSGRVVRLWNGVIVRVRVHLLFVLADLPAMQKLTHLRGFNAVTPCRFCNIQGVYVGHTYFPHALVEENPPSPKRKKRRKTVKQLWYIDALPMRTAQEIYKDYDIVKSISSSKKSKEVEEFLKDRGFSSVRPSPLLMLQTVHPFSSFPPDIMHLFFENVAKDMVSIWSNSSSRFPELAYLSPADILEGVELTLRKAGSGIPSEMCRRPRCLVHKSKWKANEWKFFVLSTSLIVLHDRIPDEVLDGWSLFVELVQRVCQWEISCVGVDQIELLAIRFYRHFSEHYYGLKRERIRLCKYTYHLLLHLADSIRKCGPISLLAQWSMESLAGYMNKHCRAPHLFAESVREKVKYQAAAKVYGLRNNLFIPHLNPEDQREDISPNLMRRSSLERYEGYCLLHPFRRMSVAKAKKVFPNLPLLLKRYYETSMSLSDEEVDVTLSRNQDITFWDRLRDEKTANMAPMIYRVFDNNDKKGKKRAACHFSGSFQSTEQDIIQVSYGRAHAFLEHVLDGEVHILVLAKWVTKGLHLGRQGQIYAKTSVSSNSLFSSLTLESVDCISHPIGIMESEVSSGGRRRNQKGSYFVDELRELLGLLSGEPWLKGTSRMDLQGLSRRTR